MSRLDRRSFLERCSITAACIAYTNKGLLAAGATETQFDSLLTAIQLDPTFAMDDGSILEFAYRQAGPSADQRRGNPALPRRWTSDKTISARAFNMIIAFEVSSEKAYNQKFTHPIWPGGISGVTAAVGYDFGYQSRDNISDDWSDIIDQQNLGRLIAAQGKTGKDAKDMIPSLTDVEISWTQAISNFRKVLKLYSGETAHYFPGSSDLSADSFGALVSLVYSRGSSTAKNQNDPLDRRREMLVIKELCRDGNFGEIPGQILNMKRIWKDDQKSRGLLKRRELEASLFQIGLAG
jgi:GH24 family phage-related lysozyme (muramidase)